MTKDELIELAQVGMGIHSPNQPEYIVCEALIKALAQTEPKYHCGNRLICLETEEYCVIHISGTDRQWVKFPDSYIGVYTNEQVAELFELLPKEPEQEPVATLWQHGETGRTRITMPDDITDCDARWFKAADLYTTPPQQELVCVCGAVWEGQKLIYTTPQRLPLTDDEIKIIWCDIDGSNRVLMRFARAIEAAHGITGDNK